MTRYLLATRHPAECHELQELLAPCGWAVRPYPVLRVNDVLDDAGWERALRLLAEWRASCWLTLTSPRAPTPLVRHARARNAEAILELPIAAVGESTAKAADRAGLAVELVGPGSGAELARELFGRLEPAAPVIMACGRDHRPELPSALEAAGHHAHPLLVYRMDPTPPRELPPLGPGLEGVLLTSPRAARLYLENVGGHPLPLPHWALGPTTQEAALRLGIECRIPPSPDFQSLAEELCKT